MLTVQGSTVNCTSVGLPVMVICGMRSGMLTARGRLLVMSKDRRVIAEQFERLPVLAWLACCMYAPSPVMAIYGMQSVASTARGRLLAMSKDKQATEGNSRTFRSEK